MGIMQIAVITEEKEAGPYQSKEKQSITITRVSTHPKHSHEPIVPLGSQWPILAYHHVLSHLPCHRRIAEDCAPEQATGVHYHLS
jgi:hypothetical protein